MCPGENMGISQQPLMLYLYRLHAGKLMCDQHLINRNGDFTMTKMNEMGTKWDSGSNLVEFLNGNLSPKGRCSLGAAKLSWEMRGEHSHYPMQDLKQSEMSKGHKEGDQ